MPLSTNERREKKTAYTERALFATEEIIPPIVYLPRNLRAHGLRITEDFLRLTVNDHTEAENAARVRGADPTGFLLALMNGQPIPTFIIEKDNSVTVHYRVADMQTRIDIAKFLMLRKKQGDEPEPDAYDAMIRRAFDKSPAPVQSENIEGEIPDAKKLSKQGARSSASAKPSSRRKSPSIRASRTDARSTTR